MNHALLGPKKATGLVAERVNKHEVYMLYMVLAGNKSNIENQSGKKPGVPESWKR